MTFIQTKIIFYGLGEGFPNILWCKVDKVHSQGQRGVGTVVHHNNHKK